MRQRRGGDPRDAFTQLARILSVWACQRCQQRGCELRSQSTLRGKRAIIIDCDKYQRATSRAGQIADCLFIEGGEPLRIAAVELKSGGLDPEKSVGQIQATLMMADQLLSPHRVAVSLPVLVHRKGLHPNDYRILRKREVAFRGLRRIVLTAKCGDSLTKLFAQYATRYGVP